MNRRTFIEKSVKASSISFISLSELQQSINHRIKDQNLKEYTDLNSIKKEVEDSKNLFKKNNWPIIDVTRRSVEETAASILKIIEIKKKR